MVESGPAAFGSNLLFSGHSIERSPTVAQGTPIKVARRAAI
jgi:hypothetical protein